MVIEVTETFALGMFNSAGSPPFPVLVLGEQGLAIAPLHAMFRTVKGRSVLSGTHSVQGLLDDWARNLAGLRELADFARSKRLADSSLPFVSRVANLNPAVLLRPGTIYCAAANYKAHVAEMRNSGFTGGNATAESGPLRPYHFLKAPGCSVGADDPIELPSDDARIDWEVELAAVIGRTARRVKAADAPGYVAGYAICNDVSCRAATWRADRPNVRSDWLAGKSYDTLFRSDRTSCRRPSSPTTRRCGCNCP